MIGTIITSAVVFMVALAIGILALSRDNLDETQGVDAHDDNITD